MGCMRSAILLMDRLKSVWQMEGVVNARALREEKEVKMVAAGRSRRDR